MTAVQKIAQGRLTLPQLAENLKNVSEACRRRGITRSRFYEYKRAFQEFGFEGLIGSLPIHKAFPNATPQEIRDRVLSAPSITRHAARKRYPACSRRKAYPSTRPR